MKYINLFEENNENNKKYTELSKDDFLEILKTECKNFSFENDQLYRGDDKKESMLLHTPESRIERGNTFNDFFIQKEKDNLTYPVVRNNSLFGICGGISDEKIIKNSKSLSLSALHDKNDELIPVDSFLVIPFDNSKIVFCPTPDLMTIKSIDKKEPKDEYFYMKKYSNNFTIPQKELKDIIIKYDLSDLIKHGIEFFTSSECLLINVDDIDWLKSQIK